MILLAIQIVISKPFKLQSAKSTKYLGMIDDKPAMVDAAHAITLDIRTSDDHQNSICTEAMCLFKDADLYFTKKRSSDFLVVLNDDGTVSFTHKKQCIAERGVNVIMDDCKDDRFNKISIVPEEIEYEYQKGEDKLIFNYGIEDTDHKRDSIIQMKKKDIAHSIVPINRHHNSHTHKVGGPANKAYYSYYSYHPNSRHSQFNFHDAHHGVPKLWGEDVSGNG